MILQDRLVEPGEFVQYPVSDLFRNHPDHHLRGRLIRSHRLGTGKIAKKPARRSRTFRVIGGSAGYLAAGSKAGDFADVRPKSLH
ncbi:hypothetical protein GCM10023107_69900 [Actinoplanes octamycinicus]